MELFEIIKHVGMTYGVGASTFAIIFYYKALEDGVIDASEKNFMHAVYFVLRIGMLILIATEVIMVAIAYNQGPEGLAYLQTPALWFRLTLLAIINANAVLMQKRIMPMWLGPSIAGGTWYAYFIVSLFKFETYTIASLLLLYTLFIMLFAFMLRSIRRVYLEKKSIF